MSTRTSGTAVVLLVAMALPAAPGQTPIGGTISTNTTLGLAQSPYLVTTDLNVTSGAVLTIEAGVMLRFTLFAGLTVVNGGIVAEGTIAQPIVFTADAASPGPGSWEGISASSISTTAASTFRDCVVAWAGRANAPAFSLTTAAAVTLERVTITDCLQNGIAIFNGNPVVQEVVIQNAGLHGIVINAGNSAPAMDQVMVLGPGDYGIDVVGAAPATALTGSLVENGIRFPNSSTFSMQVSGNTFTNYDAFRARMGARLVDPFLNGNTITGVVAGTSDLQVLGGTLTQSATWPSIGIILRVTGLVDVFNLANPAAAPTLTLEAGLAIRCGSSANFRIGFSTSTTGALVAQGTAQSPITFTSSAAQPLPGQWQGISITGGSGSVLEHVVIEYGGAGGLFATPQLVLTSTAATLQDSTVRLGSQQGIRASGSAVSITGSTISGNALQGVQLQVGALSSAPGSVFQNNLLDGNGGVPLRVDAGAFPVLGGNVYTNNGSQAVEIVAQGGNVDMTFANEGIPYVFTGTVFVAGPQATSPVRTMTVAPGVTLRFDSGRQLIIGSAGKGVLVAQGTPSSPILFTASSASPSAGFWSGISFNNTTPASVLEHCIVEYGGAGGTTNVSVSSSSPRIERCTIRSSSSAGIRLTNASPLVTRNLITANATGVQVAGGGSDASVIDNDISGNGTGLAGPLAGQPFVARGNWWGDAAGPAGSGPGAGDPVTNAFFEPWLTQTRSLTPGWQQVLVAPDALPATTGLAVFSGTFSEAVDWTITIRDGGGAVVRSFAGTGTTFSQGWNGEDAGGTPLPNGTYGYVIAGTAVAGGAPLAPAAGDLLLTSTGPVSQITAPAHGQAILSHLPFAVMGTVSGSYQLHLGVGLNPVSYALVQSGSFPVANGPLGTFSPQTFLPGPHTLRLTVGSPPNQAVLFRQFALDYLTITQVARDPVRIDPTAGEVSTISYTLNGPADLVTASFYSYPGLSLLTSLTAVNRPAGTSTLVWDGLGGGALPPDGAYFFTLAASNAMGQTGTYNSASAPLLPFPEPAWMAPSVTGDAGFNPYRNDEVTMAFTFVTPAFATIQVHSQNFGSPTLSFRDVITQRPYAPGTYSVAWDGRRDDGTVHQGPFFPYYAVPERFPVNGILVDAPDPEIQGFRAEAWVIQTAFREVAALTYTLTRASFVTIVITDPNGNAVRALLANAAQAAGFQSVEWDGRDDQGLPVAVEGDYRVDVSAVDAALGRAASRVGTVVVYR